MLFYHWGWRCWEGSSIWRRHCGAAVRGAGHHGIPPVVSGPYRSGGRHFPCAGGSCGAVMDGDADSSGAGDDLVK